MENVNKPSRLYKFQPCTAQTLLSLKSRSIWFGSPLAFNDPFDCAVPFAPDDVSLAECEKFLESRTEEQKSQTNEDRKFIDEFGKPTEEFRSMMRRIAGDVFPVVQNDLKEMGVTCFSESHENILLWSHYGESHKGFCLEFDTTSDVLNKLHKVNYSNEIAQINVLKQISGESNEVLKLLLQKAKCWEYEQEWRAVHVDSNVSYTYGVDALTGIYFGAAMTFQQKELICHLLHGSATKLYEMRKHKNSFLLETVGVNYRPYQYRKHSI